MGVHGTLNWLRDNLSDTHKDKSQEWKDGYSQAIRDALDYGD